ncbi:MAG: thioesterase family protein [Parvularculaceae bacterium]
MLACTSFDTALVETITPSADDFDLLGHVNNIVYLRWAQTIATKHWQLVAPTKMRAAFLFVVLRHEIDYRDGIEPGQSAEIRTWLGRAKGPRFERFVDIRKPGADKSAAFARTDWCMIDATTRRPVKINQEVLAAFQVPG